MFKSNMFLQYLQDNVCPGIKLENEIIYCLTFADDLIALSRTAEGLQKSLNLLYQFMQKNGNYRLIPVNLI